MKSHTKLHSFKPVCRRIYPRNDYVFQQDSVLSHTNMVTQAHFGEATHKFIKIDEWPLQVQSVTLWITPYGTPCCSETDQNGVEGQNNYVMGEDINKKYCKSISTCS